MNITREMAARVLEVVDRGLVSGVGNPVPGQMCVEAAVCYALGEPHGDKPTCVGSAVRAFKIRLNDSRWSSGAARTQGLRAIAIAQLGSNEINQLEFAQRVTLAVIREILPPMLRRRKLDKEADACAVTTTLAEGRTAVLEARNVAAADAAAAYVAAAAAAYVAAYVADADAAAAADAYVADVADAAAADAAAAAAADADAAAAYVAAADAAAAADADAAADAYVAAAAADAAAAAADAAAAAAADAYVAARDQVLRQAAEIGVRVLTELKSPGVQWLSLLA
jgi:hypothetical protein